MHDRQKRKNEQPADQQHDHLKRLRDLLDLPFNTLNGGTLHFVLAEKHQVIARHTDTGHLSLICGKLLPDRFGFQPV